MNRTMRRALEKRETEKSKTRIPFSLNLRQAEQIITKKQQHDNIVKANRLGRMQGLERMYELMLEACKKVKGIGPKRKEALRLEIVNLIINEVDNNGDGN